MPLFVNRSSTSLTLCGFTDKCQKARNDSHIKGSVTQRRNSILRKNGLCVTEHLGQEFSPCFTNGVLGGVKYLCFLKIPHFSEHFDIKYSFAHAHYHPITFSFISLQVQHTDIFSFITHNAFNFPKSHYFLIDLLQNFFVLFQSNLTLHNCVLSSLFNGDIERLILDLTTVFTFY